MAKLIRRLSLMILLCAIMAGTMITVTNASGVGVSVGNVFDYNMVTHYTGTSEIPGSLYEINQTKLITVTVTSVSGSLINSTIKTLYRNGSEIVADGACDVDSGGCIGLPFIEANLAAGDIVNPSASDLWYVNETVTRTYQGVAVETNHISFDSSYTLEDNSAASGVIDYYFDKTTGVLLEYKTTVTQPTFTSIVDSELVSSNVGLQGSASSPPTALYITAVVIIIVVVGAVIVLYRRRNAAQQGNQKNPKKKKKTAKTSRHKA